MANPIPLPDFLQQRAFDFAADKLTNVWKKHVRNRVDYALNCHKKVKKLGNVVDELKKDRNKVHDKAEEDEGLYGREVYHVKAWLRQVDGIISEYGKLKDEHSNHVVINLKKRYLCSKRAEEIKELVMELQKEKQDNISYWQQQQQQQQQWPSSGFMGVTFSDSDYMEFKSRRTTMKKIMASLEDSNSRLVGVYGPAGIGKTTLVIKAAKQAQEIDKLFDMVIMVNVTKRPDTKKIQGQIAEMLGMKLEEESEEARATSIQERLKNEKDNILIILDDLYAKLDLNALGIPLQTKEESSAIVVHNQNPELEQNSGRTDDDKNKMKAKTSFVYGSSKLKEHNRGYKVLTEMDVKAASIFSINFLNSNEAETLFKMTAAIADKNVDELKKYAPDQIAEKCNGLPMLIVTTARALKNQKNHLVWKDTLGKLAKLAAENPNAAPEYSTRLSYGLLENEELKLTFLLCARMDHNALVADLVKYCIGLGFLQGVYSVWEVRDKVQMLLAKLKDAGLLSNSYSSNRFTMQNLVRDAALSISSEERHVFTMTEGKFDEWPSKDELERCTVISLKHCDFIRGFSNSLKCPSLSVFHIENNDPSLEIPDSFFQEMKELRVLILIGVNLSSLPSSIKCLTNLRMLCLEQCILGEKLELIGELKNLRILSFSGSDIRILPDKLSLLSKLQIFDISNCYKLRIVPYCIMSSLTRLEELYMRNIPFQWEVDDGKQKHQIKNASLSVLGDLDQLTNLDLQIPSVSYLPKNLFFDKLYSYKITIGSSIRYSKPDFQSPNKYDLSRCLAIYQKDGFDIHSHEAIKILFERVEILLLEKLNSVKDIFYELNLQGFSYLKHLTIARNCSIQCIIGPKRREHYLENAFPKLESLHLYKLRKMEQICSHQSFTEPSFSKLKTIKIELCGMLKNVFLSSVVGFLTALETIEVSECNSLKEIVVMETNKQIIVMKQSLFSIFLNYLIGFYPISSEGDTKSLFHRKIEVPKLERMELSMLEINHIWSDQIWATCHTVNQSNYPLQKLKELGKKYHTIKQTYSPFQNLIHLDVNGCWNLESLWSFSIARHLVNLQSLSVTDCNMTHIFPQHQGGGEAKPKKLAIVNQKQDGIFPNLKTVKLSSIKSLCKIWNSDEAPGNSFGKLNTLIIDKCDELVNVIPHYMAERLSSLSCLRVTNCSSIKVIFEEADDDKIQDAVLQDIHLEALPKLEHVFKWKKEVKWSDLKLQKIWVHHCGRLENIFSISVVKNVKIKIESLESLVVSDCSQLREIVGKGEDAVINSSSPIQFEFPKLTTVKFFKLSKFQSLYLLGAFELSCPTLNDLSIESCDLLEPFEEISSHAKVKNILFPENSEKVKAGEVKAKEVINNKLKFMQIESRHIVRSSTGYDCRRDNLEELQLSGLKNTDIIYCFLHCNPNLKSLCLNDCSFEKLKPRGTRRLAIGVVPKLKSLTLTNNLNLDKICFEQDVVLQRIESLVIKNCSWLRTVASSSASLTHLTILEVVGCQKLKYVMLLSTAKSLNQLKTMKVINCENLEEIVSEKTQGQEEKENVGTEVPIIFKQLTTLELVSLVSLNSFCSSKNCAFKFPSLENFIVSACPNMKNFSKKNVECGPNLQKLYYVHDKEKKRWYWHEDNIGSTIRYIFDNKKFFEGMNQLWVSDSGKDLLKSIWLSKEDLLKDWFSGLKTLELYCWDASKTHAIPSNVLCSLKSLQELEVWGCERIESIFEMDDTKSWESSFKLKKLSLTDLPSLKSVWQHDKREILLGFQNLQQVTINVCSKLTSVFPSVLAKDLKRLEELHISYCDELQEIVGKDQEEAVEGSETFKFPRLTTLKLSELPQLNDFTSGRLTLECLELKHLQLFPNQQQKYPQGSIFKVEKLWLNPNRTWAKQFMNKGDFHHYLNELYLRYSGYNDDGENSTSPFEILADKMLPKLEIIDIYGNKHCKTMNIPKEAGERMLDLKELKLDSLDELNSISGLEYLLKLRLLEVSRCHNLTTGLVLHSYSNLKELHIKSCNGLKCLLTSSAAKMLIHLEELRVEWCDSLKEIVGKEEESGTEDIIEFKRLHRITLEFIYTLECFYSGNATLQFPSLIRLDILGCPKMKIFSQTEIHVKPPFQVIYSNDEVDRLFFDDLNVAVACQFLQERRLDLGNHSALKDLWLDKVHILGKSYSFGFKLKSLVVEGCDEFFTTTILPSHLLPFFSRLQELVVRGCNSVETIFKVKDTQPDIVIPLKKLTLKKLPNLRHVWNKDSEGKLSLPKLEEVIVDECASLKSLFPESVNIQRLEVKNCEKLVKIITRNELAKEEEANKQVNIFSKLSCLKLWNLPNLSYIYHGMEVSEISLSNALLPLHLLPSLHKLEELVVGNCGSFETIFDVKDAPTNDVEDTNIISVEVIFEVKDTLIEIPLKKLTLEHLPTLSHIWNKDLKGSSLSFLCLEEVVVNGCKSLTSLLSESLTMSNIKKIDVKNCEKLVEIVIKDEADNKKTNKELTMFPKLTLLTLHNLPNLTYIYAGMEILNLSELRELDISHCKFAIDSTAKVFTPHLERLSIDMEGVMMLDRGLLHLDPENIKYLRLQGFNDIDDSDAASAFNFFPNKVPLPNIQILVVADSAFKEIFPLQKPDEIIHSELLVRELELRNLHKLESIGLQHTWVASSNLTSLKVEGCASLKYLFTSSAAKCLVQLEQLHISNCEALESLIVDYQPHNDDHDVIIFKKLEKLSLSQIPKLENFYTGQSTLNFPSLEEVEVTECNRLEYMFTFSTAKSLKSLNEMKISKCESLETVVLATQKGDKSQDLTFSDFTYLSLSESPKLGSFFTGKSTLKFQAYLYIEISQCKIMKTFSHGDVEAPKLKMVKIDGVSCWIDNLNAAVSQQFEKRSTQH
ncbi:hypothetical protein Ahy_B02g058169 [Arachis hypogaea]|uniref:AAA+ ATPase domain-containing protein n=1 Tax=Arachis hypogaea TaxID=3818 RepID=A0A445ADZ6_ARAHY|nr:hypothetical protein Ahy_B02g058169 [Arachis hypogaea]